ncbi:MAG: sigma factor [Archangium sp.]|nr:sigma factor [Archangium sp.]
MGRTRRRRKSWAHRPAVLRLLTRLTHDASLAEDLTQETFVTALQHADSWRGEGAARLVDVHRAVPLVDVETGAGSPAPAGR